MISNLQQDDGTWDSLVFWLENWLNDKTFLLFLVYSPLIQPFGRFSHVSFELSSSLVWLQIEKGSSIDLQGKARHPDSYTAAQTLYNSDSHSFTTISTCWSQLTKSWFTNAEVSQIKIMNQLIHLHSLDVPNASTVKW